MDKNKWMDKIKICLPFQEGLWLQSCKLRLLKIRIKIAQVFRWIINWILMFIVDHKLCPACPTFTKRFCTPYKMRKNSSVTYCYCCGVHSKIVICQ